MILCLQSAISATAHACSSDKKIVEVSYDDNTTVLDIMMNVNLTSASQDSLKIGRESLIDIFRFDEGCNLQLRSFKILMLGKCNVKVLVSDAKQSAITGDGETVFDSNLTCTSIFNQCWRADATSPLPPWPVAGKFVAIRVKSIQNCVLRHQILDRDRRIWLGATLKTKGESAH